MFKSKVFACILLFCLSCASGRTQSRAPLTKYHYGAVLTFGTAFPNYIPDNQNRWKPGVYAAGGITIEGTRRLSPNWQLNVGLGLNSYFLNNKGPVDNYSLDFLSPQLQIGTAYLSKTKQLGYQYVLQLGLGSQLGYTKKLVEVFETYQVDINGQHLFYHFVRGEWGIRWPWRKRLQRGLPKPFSQVGVFYRYHFNKLGTARFTGNDYILDLEPSGNIFGGYFRILLPASRQRLKLPDELPPAPLIYHPRMK